MNAVNKQSIASVTASGLAGIGQNILERIGNTPLLRLERIGADFPNARFYAKAEWFNPGGSVKDRAAYSMIREGERTGALKPGKIILDATSGNTGIAYAMVGAALGYRVKLCLPSSASTERKQILAAYGVEVVITPGDEGTDGAIRRVRKIYEEEPEKYFYPDQYSNAESCGALFRHCPGDLESDRRSDYAFRRRAWNQRNFCGHHTALERAESRDSLHQHAAGLGIPRAGRFEAHGDCDCSGYI